MKTKIKIALQEVYGTIDSYLETQYEKKVVEILLNEDWNRKRRWATYNQLIIEIKNSLNDELKVKELQYRLTDIEDPNKVCIDVLENIQKHTPELERLYDKIRNFI